VKASWVGSTGESIRYVGSGRGPLLDWQRSADIRPVRASTLIASDVRGWRIGTAAFLCLAPLVLAACGMTTAKPTAPLQSGEPRPALKPLPRSIHAPPGFSPSGCPATTVPAGTLCFTRPKSIVLTRSIFAQIVRAAGVTVRASQVFCPTGPPAKKPRAPYILVCRALGSSGLTNVLAHASSLVTATGHSFSAATRDLPMQLRGTNHGAPIVIEFVNFGLTTSRS
jgi:hypothetical protein